MLECIGRGPVDEVYKGYWHGEVAIKKFHLQDATTEQLDRFKEEASCVCVCVGRGVRCGKGCGFRSLSWIFLLEG